MTEFDEVSRAIGNIEGQLARVLKTQDEHGDELKDIKTTLTNHRIKTAGVAGGVTVGLNILLIKLKSLFA